MLSMLSDNDKFKIGWPAFMIMMTESEFKNEDYILGFN